MLASATPTPFTLKPPDAQRKIPKTHVEAIPFATRKAKRSHLTVVSYATQHHNRQYHRLNSNSRSNRAVVTRVGSDGGGATPQHSTPPVCSELPFLYSGSCWFFMLVFRFRYMGLFAWRVLLGKCLCFSSVLLLFNLSLLQFACIEEFGNLDFFV